ncbi:MAG TPA: ABC transporter permease [Pyrinomonadaceae bacterium]|nr:ABC transporter permease [Pyrinomonadaceae bacterium]
MSTTTRNSASALDAAPAEPADAPQAPPPADPHPTHSATPPPVDRTLVVIEPTRSWGAIRPGDLWAYRELLYFLIWRDVKVRYKQTALGVLWAVLQPVFMMLIFSVFFGRLAGVETDGVPYPLFAYVGLVPWTFFANSVSTSGNSLVGNAHLITKVYFPRLIVPAAAIGAGLVDFALAFVILVGIMAFYGVAPTWQLAMLPAMLALTVLFTLAVGTWLAALNVKYRDVRFALPFLIQLWLFISSVIVPSSAVPPRWRALLILNPVSAIIEGWRAALLGLPFDWAALAVSAAMTLAALFTSAYYFRRVERDFSDII